MMDTTTQSGQRPPVANRPTDADLARLLDQAAMTIHRLARLVVPEVAEDARKVRDRASAAAAALDAAPSASCAWCGRPATENGIYCSECRHSREAIEDAFPHLAPTPEP